MKRGVDFEAQSFQALHISIRSEQTHTSVKATLTISTTSSTDLPDPFKLDSDQMEGLLELTQEDLDIAQNLKMGRICVLLFLHNRPRVSQAAIKTLVSRWDEETVKALLKFQKIEVTNEIIRYAAGNFKHGSKIMELLLSSENT
jgi:hypothetical protein